MISPTDNSESGTPAPVWVLLGHKAGDNNQVLALAESLGVRWHAKHMCYRTTEILSNLLLGPNLCGIDKQSRSRIIPPWPRLIISAGRRNEPIALWIRDKAPHPVKLVHIGRPWAKPERFDLIVTTPQYQLADAPNVLRFDLPLYRIIGSDEKDQLESWKTQLCHLPTPWFAVLLGGDSGKFYLDTNKARRIGHMASDLAAAHGGSLLITTSARSPYQAGDDVSKAVSVPHFLFDWHKGGEDNPYRAFLELAAAFVVTGDSMSMLAEACATRKPVYIFDMKNDGPGGIKRLLRSLSYKSLTHQLAQQIAPLRMRRDVSLLHSALIEKGRAVWLGQDFAESHLPPLPDTTQATLRVLEMLDATN
ncbi:MAG: mitochondrial fission ELM1 family protein [Gammaproteobacteria bacterium]